MHPTNNVLANIATTTLDWGGLRITQLRAPPGLRLEGDLDHATLPDLRCALDSLVGDGDILLDLVGVTFIDVGSLRALVNTAQRLGEGRVLTMCSAPPPVLRLLQLTGWHSEPRLFMSPR